jgi:hypothetical protein
MFLRGLIGTRYFLSAAKLAKAGTSATTLTTTSGSGANDLLLSIDMRSLPTRTAGNVEFHLQDVVSKFKNVAYSLNVGYAHPKMLNTKIVLAFGEWVALENAAKIF